MQFLKQSTASQVIRLGPFVDDTDFKTAETALTIANTDIKIYKGDAATTETNKNSGGATHVAAGRYHTTLDATDTNTLGRLDIHVKMTGALEVWKEFTVVPAHVYDSMIGNANGPAPAFGIIDIGTAQAVGATSLTLRAGFSATNDVIIGTMLWVYSSTNGLHERAIVTDWDNTTKLATIGGWVAQTPSGTILYALVPSIGAGAADLAKFFTLNTGSTYSAAVAGSVVKEIADHNAGLDAAGVRSAVGLASANLDTQLTAIDDLIDTEVAAIKADTAAILDDTGTSGVVLTAPAIDAIHDEQIDGTVTMRQMLRGFASALLGKASGMATTTAVFRDVPDTKARITATVDADGNRTAVTLDLT